MIVVLFALSLHGAAPDVASHRLSSNVAERADLSSALLKSLMGKFAAMNDTHRGIFHDDVSAVAAPFFPAGQSFQETQRVLAAQGFGPLRRFKGEATEPGEQVYVSRHDLMTGMFSDVHVVIDFTYSGASEDRLVLRKLSAFLQSASM